MTKTICSIFETTNSRFSKLYNDLTQNLYNNLNQIFKILQGLKAKASKFHND